MTIDSLSIFTAALDSPYNEARQRKAQGQKVIGWLLTDMPEELIHAAGAFPVGILGSNNTISLVDSCVQVWMCSLMRSSLEMCLQGELGFLDGILIPQTCDTARMMVGLMRRNSRTPFFDIYQIPRQANRPSARVYLTGELKRLKNKLEQLTKETITDEKLRASIRLFNENRRLLRRMFGIHASYPGLLKSREAYSVIKAAMYMDKAEHNRLLRNLIKEMELKTGNMTGKSSSKVRLVVSGGVWEPPAIMDLIDEAGGIVIGDDLHTGARYLGPDVDEEDDVWTALVDRQLKRIPSAIFDNREQERRQFLIDLARRSDASGLLFWHLKFCEPENYDYNDMREGLNMAGIPNMRIETELINLTLGQIRTRLEAFIEMIGGEFH